ncbi:MAG: class I SAM-dependent methyltransferase [Bacteroidales bacterium]|nr:class I SAM-dependent methyltransferase [Bacteroidales bacterium]
MKEKLKSIFFKIWYWYISTIDKNAEVVFMNFGYSKNNQKIILEKEDEKNRYSVQLYNLVATGVNIIGKNILEVGCGRGGGLSYINRYLFPNKVTGIDLNKKAIEFCKKFYKEKNNTFLQANAQKLPFKDSSFEVVINIESSHRYPQVDLFINEVYRVLKDGGNFLFADFGQNKELKMLEKHIKNTQFKFVKKENITNEVVEALTLSTPERKVLINKIAPVFLRNLAHKFAATAGTSTYNHFANRYYEYVYYILKK